MIAGGIVVLAQDGQAKFRQKRHLEHDVEDVESSWVAAVKIRIIRPTGEICQSGLFARNRHQRILVSFQEMGKRAIWKGRLPDAEKTKLRKPDTTKEVPQRVCMPQRERLEFLTALQQRQQPQLVEDDIELTIQRRAESERTNTGLVVLPIARVQIERLIYIPQVHRVEPQPKRPVLILNRV
jgi:hypothetical protein